MRFKSKEIKLHGLSLPGFAGTGRQSLSRSCLVPVTVQYVEKSSSRFDIRIIISLCLMGFEEKHLVLWGRFLGVGRAQEHIRATLSIFTEWFSG